MIRRNRSRGMRVHDSRARYIILVTVVTVH